MRNLQWPGLAIALAIAGVAWAEGGANAPSENAVLDWTWALPSYVPPPRVPADNPMSEAKFQLGRHLFFDKRLSMNGTKACASCHLQERAFTDGRAVSPGATGEFTTRNAQSIANAAWNATYTWANPSLVSLERQAAVPLFGIDPVEMGVTDTNREEILERLRREPRYKGLFASAYPSDTKPASLGNVIRALASFQRGVISFSSKYDEVQQGRATFSAAEKRGFELFFGERAECHHCHGSSNFNDQFIHERSRDPLVRYHNTGLYNIDGAGGYPALNRGLIELTGNIEDVGKFRAPSLRNVAVTAPYMHDGSIATLEEVVDTYAKGGRHLVSGRHAGDGRANPLKSEFITNIELDAQDKADLVAFLKTLTDETLLTSPRYSDPWK